MTKTQALHQFFSSFGLKAYEENSVPDLTTLPYLTYTNEIDSLNHDCMIICNLWYRSTSWKEILEKADEIARRVKSHGHVSIPFDGGYLYIKHVLPFAQTMEEPSDKMIRRVYINITVEYLSSY